MSTSTSAPSAQRLMASEVANMMAIKGTIVHRRRISRRLMFFDLLCDSPQEHSQKLQAQWQIVLKPNPHGHMSAEDFNFARYEVHLGDIICVYGVEEQQNRSKLPKNTTVTTTTPNYNHNQHSPASPATSGALQRQEPRFLNCTYVTVVSKWVDRRSNPKQAFIPQPFGRGTRNTKATSALATNTQFRSTKTPPSALSSRDHSNPKKQEDTNDADDADDRKQGDDISLPSKDCKAWLHHGQCAKGDNCRFFHDSDQTALRSKREQWRAVRLKHRRHAAAKSGDPNAAHSAPKALRARIFAQFLVDTFGITFLQSGSGVLDIAGGRGDLSFELLHTHGVKSTVIDPRPVKLSKAQCKLIKKMKKSEASGGSGSGSTSASLSKSRYDKYLPPQMRMLLTPDIWRADTPTGAHLRTCSLVIAMHPDQATGYAVQLATEYQKPFAIVPCCVFSRRFTDRILPLSDTLRPGRLVTTRDDLIRYLSHMANTSTYGVPVETIHLPFEGANVVLFRRPRGADVFDSSNNARLSEGTLSHEELIDSHSV